jgi:hypothetical protein
MSLWADSGDPGGRFGTSRKGPGHLEAVESLKARTRERFQLSADETVVVSESTPNLPGFPAHETVVAFWTSDGTRYHFTTFKPVEAVEDDDIPPAWLMESLALSQGVQCSCC